MEERYISNYIFNRYVPVITDFARETLGDAEGSSSQGKKKKIQTQYTYRTCEDIVEEATRGAGGVQQMAREYSHISKVKVIDMTGKEQRVLSGYSALSSKKTTEPSDLEAGQFATQDKLQLDKLAYNLNSLVDFCEHVPTFFFSCSLFRF